MPPRHHAVLVASLVIVLLCSMLATPAAHAQSAPIRPHPNGKVFARPDGKALFVLGYNYEGPFDRAWRMWEQFDAGLIGQDLARARGGGANTVRIFVQQPLPGEIMAGDFRKLDTVIDLASRQGLLVLLTLGDYDSRDLAALAEVNRRIAEHYRGNPTILAYDLRNEPQFLTLASATYPAGVVPGLQRADLVGLYGERVARDAIGAYRASADGRVLPGWWSDEQVYAYANNLEFFRAFLGDAERWTGAGSGRVITDFPAAPEAQGWQPFWAAMNDTLAAWIDSQRAVLQAGDPGRMLTIGWSNPILARLPANGDRLDFMALHRFPRPGVAAANQIIDLAAGLKRAFPGRPVMLEEIGFATSEIDPEGAAALEMGVALRAYSEGYAGYLKWMLTDLPPVGNPREDTFGALRIDASPKPLFHTLGAFGTYLGATAAEPGGSLTFWDGAGGPNYSYITRDAHYIANPEASGPDLSFRLNALGQVMLRKRGAMYLLATQAGEITLNLRELMQPWLGGVTVEQRSGDGWAPVAAALEGDTVRFGINPATPYRISLPRATDPAAPRGDCRYFPETQHNLCGAFLSYWQRHGGLALFGYPISEEFRELNRNEGNTYTVQYFERNRFEYHPELAGTQYEVLLGLLGNDLTANRRAESAFQPVGGPPPGADFYPETGHSLGGAFRAYWQRHGGLAVFGYPTSEEFQEYNPADGKIYTVQYFERNRFEYHPELAGTQYEVLLGLLGNQVVDANGWR